MSLKYVYISYPLKLLISISLYTDFGFKFMRDESFSWTKKPRQVHNTVQDSISRAQTVRKRSSSVSCKSAARDLHQSAQNTTKSASWERISLFCLEKAWKAYRYVLTGASARILEHAINAYLKSVYILYLLISSENLRKHLFPDSPTSGLDVFSWDKKENANAITLDSVFGEFWKNKPR